MTIVDAQDRFIWASVGFPGNSHDSIIFQSTDLWHNITEKNIIPSISQVIEVVTTKTYQTIYGGFQTARRALNGDVAPIYSTPAAGDCQNAVIFTVSP
ncbi:hypothetical protein pdam_00020317 [Pocillopora damicornis]|uniref:DDE Tnp4 domain-containing protein n=1 Tax=Pocillopora damicornis TaxID=46731 RepID=A0A3M6T7Q8_POCDA|nr:hypothetical protein pdam_00020317 [Pocillopora damicornis]